MRTAPALLNRFVARWGLSFGLVLLASAPPSWAQVHPLPRVNLFGDEIVKKLDVRQGMIFAPAANSDETQSAPRLEGFAHTLVFHNGTQLRGEIVSLAKAEIVWSRPDISEPMRFRRDDIRRIVLTPSPDDNPARRRVRIINAGEDKVDPAKSGFATVKLPGGDWLHGDLSSADGQNFRLKISEQTTFTLGRNSICWLHSGADPAPAFSFTGRLLDMGGWMAKTPGAEIEVVEGTLVVNGTDWIGREMASMRRFELSFELPEDAEDNTQIWLQPYGAEVNSYTTGTIQLRLGRAGFQHCIFANRMDTVSTPLPKDAMNAKGPVRYRVLYDGPGERFIVIRNGQQLGDWKFIDEKNAQNARLGREFNVTGICFQRQQHTGKNPLKINQLKIQPWDGMLSPDGDSAGDGDCLLSIDGKQRAGWIESFSKDELVFSGEKIKRKPGAALYFAHEPAPLDKADAMLQFGNLGELSAADLEISEGKVRFTSVIAPLLEAPVATLQTIAFPKHIKGVPSKPAGILVFKNGDELPGSLVSAVKGEPWRWQILGGREIAVRPDYIAGFRSDIGENSSVSRTSNALIELLADFRSASGDDSLAPPADSAVVELRNGDRLRGEFAGFHEGKVQFRHASLGTFALAHDRLWSLYPNSRTQIRDGSQNPAQWMAMSEGRQASSDSNDPGTGNSNRWIYLDGSYILRPTVGENSSNTSLGSNFKEVPERFELRCDVTSASGEEPNFSIQITAKQNSGNLQASFSYGRLYAYTFSQKSRGSRSRQVMYGDKIPEPTSRRNFRLFVDSKLGTVDIFADGVFLTKMGQQEAERLPGLGNTIRLYSYSQGSSVIISNIWIGPWNGELPKAGADAVPATLLTNGDVVNGTPKGFREGKLQLDSEIGPLELPMEKVLSVEFGGTMSAKPAAARIRLADGCAISVDSFRWHDSQFTAHSEVLGELQIPVKLISELVLAPSAPRAPKNPPAKKIAQQPTAPEANALEAIDGP